MNAIAVEAINRPLYDLSNHPDHAKLIGQIVVVFSAIELQFLSLFAHLMRAPPWRSQTAYGEVINRNTHMDMIRGLTKDMPMKGDFDARILDAVEESRTIADLRNKYVHGFWIEKKRAAISAD
jgi:hypothetical protein